MNYTIQSETETTVVFSTIVCADCGILVENVTQNKLGKYTAGQLAQSYVCLTCKNEAKSRRRR